VYESRVPFTQISRAWSDQAQVFLLVTLALFASMEWNGIDGCFIPSLASHRLADCFSFVVLTSCSIAILTFVQMYQIIP
jgi:hypothetical protein